MPNNNEPGDDVLETISRFVHFFLPERVVSSVEVCGDGNINDTFRVSLEGCPPVVLQRINHEIFPEPDRVADNVRLVTEHIRTRCSKGSFALIRTVDGMNSYRDNDGNTWRMIECLEGTVAYNSVTTENQAFEGGKVLGDFHRQLDDLDPALLHDPLPGFHDFSAYSRQYQLVRRRYEQPCGSELRFCLNEADKRIGHGTFLEEMRRGGEIQNRVIHGDPKVANILFDEQTGAGVALIDLDTVSSGLLQHDLGDCLRSFCNSLGEHTEMPADTCFDIKLCEALLVGYRDSGAPLSRTDRRLLFHGVRLLTYELALRFLTDYLQGNHYFKVQDPAENLRRALVQFYLLRSIESQRDEIEQIAARL